MSFLDDLVFPKKEDILKAYVKSPRYVLDKLGDDIKTKYLVKGTDDPYFLDEPQYRVEMGANNRNEFYFEFQNKHIYKFMKLDQVFEYPSHVSFCGYPDIEERVVSSHDELSDTISELIKLKRIKFAILSNLQ
jgi:hypothetical protein